MDHVPVLDLGSDLRVRHRWFVPESLAHPAKLHLGLLQVLIDRYTEPGMTIFDPMGGIGSTLYAATQQRHVVLHEVEPRWLALAAQNAAHIQARAGFLAGQVTVAAGDARAPWGVAGVDVALFSPPYGVEVRKARWHSGRVARYQVLAATSRRWAHLLGQAVTAGAWGSLMFEYGQHADQIGHLRGARYWAAMGQIYAQAQAALAPGALLILVLKDHVYRGQHVPVVAETIAACERRGFRLIDRIQRRVYPLSLWQRRRKERGDLVIEVEDALVFRRITEDGDGAR